MKLSLNNFRCYSGSNEFTFKKYTSISGPSGSGKSTIIEGIVFALYGKIRNCSWLNSQSKYKVVLETDNLCIERTKQSLFLKIGESTFSDQVAQSKINAIFGKNMLFYSQKYSAHFLELAPSEQLETLEEILFSEEVDIKDIKKKFAIEKRELERVYKESMSTTTLIESFISNLSDGPPVSDIGSTDVHSLRHELAFLKNKDFLRRQICQKRKELIFKISELKQKQSKLIASSSTDIPYTAEQLYDHIKAEKALKSLNWKAYLTFTVDECEEYIKGYEHDKSQLLLVRKVISCHNCSAKINADTGHKVPSDEQVDEILSDLCKDTVEEGFDEIKKQLKLFYEYKNIRQRIDELTPNLLCIEDAQKKYDLVANLSGTKTELTLNKKECAYLESQLSRLDGELEQFPISDQSVEIDTIQKKLDNVGLYENQLKHQTLRENYQHQLQVLKEANYNYNRKLSALARAGELFADSEQIYMEGNITSLTGAINTYSSEMFEGQAPVMEMYIEGLSTGAKKLRILYKFKDCTYTYDMFSSGEKTRLNLCFLLAFANFENYKMLLLDEASRHLDDPTATRVRNIIKNNFRGYIILVEHEPFEESQMIKLAPNILSAE